MLELIGWIASGLSIIGTLFSAKKNIWCWPIWILSCLIWSGYSMFSKQWALLSVWIGFIVANIYGWKNWYRDMRENEGYELYKYKFGTFIPKVREKSFKKKLEEINKFMMKGVCKGDDPDEI